MNKKYYFLATVLLFPTVSFAALDGLTGLLKSTLTIMNLLIPAVFGLAIVYFFYGMGQFILKDAGNDKTRNDGKQKMLWGVIALFVMASIFGIIKFIGDATGIPTPITGTTAPATTDPCAGLPGCQY